MGAGIPPKVLRAKKYRSLKTFQRELEEQQVPAQYKDLELRGKNFVIYFAGSRASNGESCHWLILRFNRNSQPSACLKQMGDIDFTDFHTRDIPEQSLGGIKAGILTVKASI